MFSWVNFLSYAVITAVTPGPNNIMSMSNAGRLGFRNSLPFNFGIWAGFSIVMLVCTFFCNALSSVIPKISAIANTATKTKTLSSAIARPQPTILIHDFTIETKKCSLLPIENHQLLNCVNQIIYFFLCIVLIQ